MISHYKGFMQGKILTHAGDYRSFLKEIYSSRKAIGAYSYRQFSRDLGLQATNFIHLVIQGKRNLSPVMAEKIASLLFETARERKYFLLMVERDQSKGAQKNDSEKKLSVLKVTSKTKVDEARYQFFSNWYVPVIREMIELQNFVPHLNWISKKLLIPVAEAKIREAISLLEKLGFIEVKGKKWSLKAGHLATEDEVSSDMVMNYHLQMIELSRLALCELPSENRDISALTMTLTPEQFKQLKKRIIEFRDEIQQELSDSTGAPTQVGQLNIQLFQVVK